MNSKRILEVAGLNEGVYDKPSTKLQYIIDAGIAYNDAYKRCFKQLSI